MKFWGYAFSCVIHLINHLSSPILQHQSLYSVLYGTSPTYDHLRVFGYYCYLYLRLFNNHKLEFQSQPCTFLGYNSQHKGYQCLTSDGRIVVSRHVVIRESWFLFPEYACSTPSTTDRVTTFVPFLSSQPHHSITFDNAEVLPNHSIPSTCAPKSPFIDNAINSLGHNSNTSSPTPVLSATLANPPLQLGNTHLMVTWFKASLYKPKALAVELHDKEPCTIDEVFASKEWSVVAQDEYDAPICNRTWTLVPLPPWCDFRETSNPVVKSATIRTIFSIAVTKQWSLHQVDVNNAFLNDELNEEV